MADDNAHPPFLGICIGGPYNGKRLGSYDREQKVAVRPRPLSLAEGYVEAMHPDPQATFNVKIGFYRFQDHDWAPSGEWHWHEQA